MILALLTTVAGIMALALLNAVYVAGEFGLIGSRQSRLESLARQGRAGAARVLAIIRDLRRMDRAIAAVQVGITCASLGLGMYAEETLAHALVPLFGTSFLGSAAAHGLASAVAVALLTVLPAKINSFSAPISPFSLTAFAYLWAYGMDG